MGNYPQIEQFLQGSGPIIDVRSPSEYKQGHIPGAINLPLFSDAERASVGTTYKQVGRKAAILLGLQIVGPKLYALASQAQSCAGQGIARIHCWRGGMRSESVAKLLQTLGLKTTTLPGGYKIYRRWVLETISKARQYKILGGFTGSGKTLILQALKDHGQQVLDLESLAQHRGSSFGMLGLAEQPSIEHFENLIAYQLNTFNSNLPIWVEDESRLIGKCKIPDSLYSQMQTAPLIVIEKPKSERLKQIMLDYGQFTFEELKAATLRLAKRLGGAKTKEIIDAGGEGDFEQPAGMLLDHYDKSYSFTLAKKKRPFQAIAREGLSPAEWAAILVGQEA